MSRINSVTVDRNQRSMKFKVSYMKPKKKGYYSQQVATFYDERDALNWEHHIRRNGCKEITLRVDFS